MSDCADCGHALERHTGDDGCDRCDCRRVALPSRNVQRRRKAPRRPRGNLKPAEPDPPEQSEPMPF